MVARSNARTRSGIVPHPACNGARGTKDMSTDPRGQYTGWRIAAIRSNETVGKCILARLRVVRYRKGGDTRGAHTHTRGRIHPSSHSPHPPRVSLSFPSSTFHRTLLLSRLNSHPCINYLVTPRVPRLVPVIYAIYSSCVHTHRVATRL